MKGKNVYILSDAHLGSWAIEHGRTQERRLVRFLDQIKDKASAIYLLGDMFDFWYEWKYHRQPRHLDVWLPGKGVWGDPA